MAGTAVATVVGHRSRGLVRTNITMVTDASGVATGTVVGVGFGRLVAVMYDGGLDASAVITCTDTKSGAAFLTYTTGTEGTAVSLRPTMVIQDQAGTVVAAADTAPNTNRDIILSGKVTVAVASGGNVETGKLSFIVDEAYVGDLAITV
jgi:hypothetical protein